MSKIDEIFGPIPGPLIQEWGQAAKFIRITGNQAYDPSTGTITPGMKEYTVKIVIDEIKYEEMNGQMQESLFSILIDPGQIDNEYITTRDSFSFDRNGDLITVKVVDVTAYRGDRPVFYECKARKQ